MPGLMGLDEELGWSGTITVDGQKIPVKNGVTQYRGQTFYVSKDGRFVANQQHQVIGEVRNGVFTPMQKPVQLQQQPQQG